MNAMETIAAREPGASIYEALTRLLGSVGEHAIEVKKTSLHITRGRAFLGVHPRASGLLVNIVLDSKLSDARVVKSEQVSRNRWHNEVLLTSPADVDAQFRGWITDAYALAGPA